MRRDLPKILRNLNIRGAEPDDEEGESDEESDDDDDDGKGAEGEGNSGKPDDNEALKSALRKERLARKKFEKENRTLKKAQEGKQAQEQSEADQAKERASAAESKGQKLAERLLRSEIDNAIIKVAGKMKFRDIDDALKLVEREDIEAEQDDDDPTSIELDEGSVETALKNLAKKKPHLLIAEGQGEPSGGKFGGSRKSTQDMDDDAMMARYDAFAITGRTPNKS